MKPRFKDQVAIVTGAARGVFAVLAAVVTMTSFRRGERWAWYAMWLLVVVPVLDASMLAGASALTPIAAVADAVVVTFAFGGLVLAYGTFFGTAPAPREVEA